MNLGANLCLYHHRVNAITRSPCELRGSPLPYQRWLPILAFGSETFFFPSAMLDASRLAGRRGGETSIQEHTAKRLRSSSAHYDAYQADSQAKFTSSTSRSITFPSSRNLSTLESFTRSRRIRSRTCPIRILP